jgi:glycerol-3-phosphate cytidylyltransferase
MNKHWDRCQLLGYPESIVGRKKIVVATGGGFDPIHEGYIRLFKEAKQLGDILVVMLNSDEQLIKKKGSTFYPSEKERREIIESIKYVDKVFIDPGKNVTCEETLLQIKPNILAKVEIES